MTLLKLEQNERMAECSHKSTNEDTHGSRLLESEPQDRTKYRSIKLKDFIVK